MIMIETPGSGNDLLAQTVADLAGCEQIQAAHLVEAFQCRPKVMMDAWEEETGPSECGPGRQPAPSRREWRPVKRLTRPTQLTFR